MFLNIDKQNTNLEIYHNVCLHCEDDWNKEKHSWALHPGSLVKRQPLYDRVHLPPPYIQQIEEVSESYFFFDCINTKTYYPVIKILHPLSKTLPQIYTIVSAMSASDFF